MMMMMIVIMLITKRRSWKSSQFLLQLADRLVSKPSYKVEAVATIRGGTIIDHPHPIRLMIDE